MCDLPNNCRGRAIHRRRRGFTLLETMVAVIITATLVSVVIVSLGDSRKSVHSGACLTQLRRIAMGFRQYAVDHQQLMPDPAASGVAWAKAIESYIGGTSSLSCPGDNEVFPLTGVSYDWRDTGDPLTTMAGRTLDRNTRATAVLTFEALPGWHAAGKINAGKIDGSTVTMDQGACFADLLAPVRSPTPQTP